MLRPFKGLAEVAFQPTGWTDSGGIKITSRLDAHAKVTGAKLYARDIRGKDMPGWPEETWHAILLMARDAMHRFKGLDLSVLGEAQPEVVVQAEDIDKAGLAATGYFASDLFVKKGDVPLYLGQPLAILIFKDLASQTYARSLIEGEVAIATYGTEKIQPALREPYGANRFTRVEGNGPMGPDVFSPVKDGWVSPISYQKSEAPVWAAPSASGDVSAEASFHGEKIRAALNAGEGGKTYSQHFETQSIDQFFMEPENGLAWYDPAKVELSAVFGVQSPLATLEAIQNLAEKADDAHKIGSIDAHFAYIGGGFGGKDHTIFPLYLAIGALFAPGHTVRLALSRFDQFQFGIKRHSFVFDTQIGVSPEGRFSNFVCDMVSDGGGLANFSVSVADVAATASSCIYYMPNSDVTTVVNATRSVTSGSMRGYGTFQSMTAMEVLVDEIAHDLGQDPFAFRRANAMTSGQLNLTGNTASGAVRSTEVLDALEKCALWQNRAADKTAYEAANPGRAYGVGVACVSKDYGTGADAPMGYVTLAADGTLVAACSAVEMGTGIGTAAARRVADFMGRVPNRTEMVMQGMWDPLQLTTSGDPWGISQADQDAAAKNPRWTPAISCPSSASIGASSSSHGPGQAAWVIFRFGLWPAAQKIWSDGPAGGQQIGEPVTFSDLRWVDGKLTGRGMQPLTLEELAARAHKEGFVTSAMVHGFNRWSWATSDFAVDGESFTAPIDALAIRKDDTTDWTLLDRTAVNFPSAQFERIGVNYTSACGAVAALGVDRVSGEVEVIGVHQVLECGRQLVPEIVSGISQGGIVMGIGHALYEYLPLYEDGPGAGGWNLNRYDVPRASQVPVWNISLEMLDPLSETDAAKGMGEVVMIPVVPAVLNGITDAIGVRVRSLPATPEKIREAM